MKKALSCLLAGGLLCGLIALSQTTGTVVQDQSSAFETESNYTPTTDAYVPSTRSAVEDYPTWSKVYINYVQSNGIFTGTTVTNYDDFCTRGQIAQAIFNMVGRGVVQSSPNDFYDGGDQLNAINWCDTYNVLTGSGVHYFGAEEFITREQFAVALHKVAIIEGTDISRNIYVLERYQDTYRISEGSKDAMAWILDKGLMTGYKGYINPHDNITRAEASVILYNFYRYHIAVNA